MIGLSVAVGKFLEALFWAIVRAGAPIALAAAAAMGGLVVLWHAAARRRKRKL